jgi:dethiobiotin synthetase
VKHQPVRGLFVAGTDTGVGKTIVTAGMAALLRSEGMNLGVWKPVQSGAYAEEEGSDAALLRTLGGVADACRDIAPLSFSAPLTPLLAAEKEGVSLTLEQIIQAGLPLMKRYDRLLIEGAGGLAVPLTATELVIDLAARLGTPLLLVARPGLGTINHTLLSLFYARQKGIHVAGIIMNGYQDELALHDHSLTSNAAMIERFGDVPVLGRIPWLPEPLAQDQLVQQFRRHADMGAIRELLLSDHF